MSTCTPCAAGRYGDAPGGSVASCVGACTATPGKYCAAGATSSVPVPCPIGTYSASGAATADCDGVCAAGWYGDTPGQTTDHCSGACVPTAGTYCGPGAISATPVNCPAGTYSTAGSLSSDCEGACVVGPGSYCGEGASVVTGVLCPAGTWSVAGAPDSNCDGLCDATAGTFCSAGATSSVPVPCPEGTYSASGSFVGNCTDGLCAAGQYGDATEQTSDQCVGACDAVAGSPAQIGYFCAAGSTSAAGGESILSASIVCICICVCISAGAPGCVRVTRTHTHQQSQLQHLLPQ
jgi:hypothetical protein